MKKQEKRLDIKEEFYNRLVKLNSDFFHMTPEDRIVEILKYLTVDMYYFFDMKKCKKTFIKRFLELLDEAEIKYKDWKEKKEAENE